MWVDSHCHIDFPELSADRQGLIGRAVAAGLQSMVTISTRVRRFDGIRAIAEAHDGIWCSVGTHPHNAHEELDVTAEDLVALATHPKVVAIGEAGLDWFYDKSPRDAQEQGFRTHIAAARQSGLPLVIHAREADARVADILTEEMGKGAFAAVLHCFTGRVSSRWRVSSSGSTCPSPASPLTRVRRISVTLRASCRSTDPCRDRRALSCAGKVPGKDQRAILCGGDRQGDRRGGRPAG